MAVREQPREARDRRRAGDREASPTENRRARNRSPHDLECHRGVLAAADWDEHAARCVCARRGRLMQPDVRARTTVRGAVGGAEARARQALEPVLVRELAEPLGM